MEGPPPTILGPRSGLAPKLIEGPRVGQRSLYQQQVLDEDTYTEALSHIITRDFFPNLPHVHATNAYLTALTNNDPELLSSSIRKLAQLAQEKEDGHRGGQSATKEAQEAKEARRMELENMGMPYIAMPGAKRAGRTPIGQTGWDTPDLRSQTPRHEYDDIESVDIAGPSQPRKKRKVAPTQPSVRDDLSLDAFQRNYTSEDNASFVQIVDKENQQRREDRWGWAWEVQKRAEIRRVEGEEKRKMILDAAVNGEWKVNAEGKRLIGGLAEGGKDRTEGEAWKERRLIAPSEDQLSGSGTLITRVTNSALITAKDASGSRPVSDLFNEEAVPTDHPLGRALVAAGLPSTALVSKEDGALVPMREITSGGGDGRGRGVSDKERRDLIERVIMGDEERENLSLGGSGADQWGYKTRNNFYFPADANTDPYPKPRDSTKTQPSRQAPPAIAHANTRLPDDDEVGPASRDRSSRRGSSPARSWVDAAVKGTPYPPNRSGDDDAMPMINDYALVPNDPSPTPENLPSLLTWGTLLATPKALNGSDDPLDAPSFRLPATQRRDEIGRRLGNKASKDMNERAKGYTPRPSGSSLSSTLKAVAERHKTRPGTKSTPGGMLPPGTPRSDHLTPAGKRLLERSLGRSPMTTAGRPGASGRNRSAAMEMGSGWSVGQKGRKVGEMSWTPSPAHGR